MYPLHRFANYLTDSIVKLLLLFSWQVCVHETKEHLIRNQFSQLSDCEIIIISTNDNNES